jgi:hypothetical protein
MFVTGVPVPKLEEIAQGLDLRVARVEDEGGGEWSFALEPAEDGGRWLITLFRQQQVCRHAYQEFVRAVLQEHPDAVCQLQLGGEIHASDVDERLRSAHLWYLREFAGRFSHCRCGIEDPV